MLDVPRHRYIDSPAPGGCCQVCGIYWPIHTPLDLREGEPDLLERVVWLEWLLAEARWKREEAIRRVRSVYDLQCAHPIRRDNYIDKGAYFAHLWWKKVLGGTLDALDGDR